MRRERMRQRRISGILVILMTGLVRRHKIAFVSVAQKLYGAQVRFDSQNDGVIEEYN